MNETILIKKIYNIKRNFILIFLLMLYERMHDHIS